MMGQIGFVLFLVGLIMLVVEGVLLATTEATQGDFIIAAGFAGLFVAMLIAGTIMCFVASQQVVPPAEATNAVVRIHHLTGRVKQIAGDPVQVLKR